ncbi:MAG: family N-acetyltransferase [Daejeonella sp.]|nr:family N-acetyltransferase [Daejeonella sp.]
MTEAVYGDKQLVVEILAEAFDKNKSFNSIIKQDAKRSERFRKVFAYYFEQSFKYGKVLLSDDRKACAIIMFPNKKALTLKGILLDVQMFFVLGLKSVKMGFAREGKINAVHPADKRIYYLLFIGVLEEFQNQGIGSQLLDEIIQDSRVENRDIYLETYLDKNIALYSKFGFEIYNELNFGFPVYCLKRELRNEYSF